MTPTEEAIAAYFERLKDTSLSDQEFEAYIARIKTLRVLTQNGK